MTLDFESNNTSSNLVETLVLCFFYKYFFDKWLKINLLSVNNIQTLKQKMQNNNMKETNDTISVLQNNKAGSEKDNKNANFKSETYRKQSEIQLKYHQPNYLSMNDLSTLLTR